MGTEGSFRSSPSQASPGNLSQLEEVLFGANTDCTITTGVMAVKVVPDGSQKVSVALGCTRSLCFSYSYLYCLYLYVFQLDLFFYFSVFLFLVIFIIIVFHMISFPSTFCFIYCHTHFMHIEVFFLSFDDHFIFMFIFHMLMISLPYYRVW